MRRKLAAFFSMILAVFCVIPWKSSNVAKAQTVIDNASLIPKYLPDSQVKLENGMPDWVKTLIMAEVKIETATEAGTFQAATRVLDHYAEMGVNGLWITPIYDRSSEFGGYSNYGLHTVWPKLTGKTSYTEGWKVVKAFVDEAHKRNIRIFFDVITWGTELGSPLYDEHPGWYSGSQWGGHAFNWKNEELREWFTQCAVDIVVNTGADGLRCDVEPGVTGYDLYKEVRKRAYAKGRKIILISEHTSEKNGVYDFEQWGVCFDENTEHNMDAANRVFLETYNIVDAVKSGKAIGSVALQKAGKGGMGRYYTFMTTCHDNSRTNVNGDRIMIGYQAIFAPFIPLWYMGEEWNNPKNAIPGGTGVLYYNRIDWAQKEQPKNKAFFEDLKKMIRIRRQYPDLFSYFPENHRNANICKVKVTGSEELQGYARYANGIGILIVPNANLHNPSARFRIAVPFSDMGIKGDKTYTITELMSGTEVGNGKKEQLSTITFAVPNGSLSVFLVQEKGAVTTAPTTGKTDRPAPSSGSSVSASAAEKPTVGSSAGSGSMNTGSVAGDQTGEMVEPTTAASDEQTSVQPSTGEKPGQSTAINDRPVAAGTTALSQHAKGLDGGWIALIIAAAVLAAGGVAVAVLLKTGKIRLRK